MKGVNSILPNIESMRFLAVLLVVLYHLGVPGFEMGYLGVDVFFVISGFVISRSIEKSISTNTFGIINFWVKRANRLLPALYTVLFVVLGLSFFFDPPHVTKDIGQAVAATVLYAVNIFYYFEIDYFNDFHITSPLIHTWSLSLEEQFYFFLPVLFLLSSFFKRKYLKGIVMLLILVSLFSWYNTLEVNRLASFYMPWNRFWQLLIGVFIGIAVKLKSNKAISIISFFALFASILLVSDILISISLVMFFTILMIVFSETKGLFIHKKLFMLGGRYSYSIYLWHQPLIYYLGGDFLIENEWLNNLFIIALTLLVSYCSYHFIENPMRYGKSIKKMVGILSFTALLLIIGFYFHKEDRIFEYKSKIWNMQGVVEDRNVVFDARKEVWDSILSDKRDIDSSVVIIGDSKGEDLLVSLNLTGNKEHFNFFKRYTWDYNRELIEIDSILLDGLDYSGLKLVVFTNTWKSVHNQGSVEFIEAFQQKYDVPIIIVNTSNFNDVSSLTFDLLRKGKKINEMPSILYQNKRYDWQKQSKELRQMLKDSKINFIWADKYQAFCDDETLTCDLVREDGKILIYDTGHLSTDGAIVFGDWFRQKFKKELQ